MSDPTTPSTPAAPAAPSTPAPKADTKPAASATPAPAAAPAPAPAPVPKVEPVLDRDKATKVQTPYLHPDSHRTVAWHQGGDAFTATGIYAGPVPAEWQKLVPEIKPPACPVEASDSTGGRGDAGTI